MGRVRYVLVGFGGIAESVRTKKLLTADDAIHNLALCAAAHASATSPFGPMVADDLIAGEVALLKSLSR